MKSAVLAAAVALAVIAAAASAQGPAQPTVPSPAVTTMLRTNTFAIGVAGGKLTGAGGARLIADGTKAQFVALGEEHNSKFIPAFTVALFDALHDRAGYNYLIDEQDPVAMRRVSERPLRGDLPAIEAAVRRDKHSFTFGTDEELALLAHVGRTSTGRGRPVWGCEQAFGGSQILRSILPKAPNAEARTLATQLLADAERREAVREPIIKDRFMMDAKAHEGVDRLRRLYAPVRDPAVQFALAALAKSFEIYGYYRNGEAGRTPGFYANNAVREEHMKSLCRDEYRFAESRDGKPPRAIAKMGHYHLYQGLSPTEIVTTGNFLANVARLNGLGFVSVAMMSREYDKRALWDLEGMRAFSAFKSAVSPGVWSLIDLRPFREYRAYRDLAAAADAKVTDADKALLKRTVYGFDYLLIMAPNEQGSFRAMGRP